MIDANRLSQSLATALKDRPHGIPVQPNRSLPLRPAPPLPIRKSVSKCPENCTTNSTGAKKLKENKNESNNDEGIVIRECGVSQSSDSVSRINFYDSANEKDLSNNDIVQTTEKTPHRVSGELVKLRHTKSLDTKDCDKSMRNEKRRKSWEYGSYRCIKKRNISNFEQADIVHNGVEKVHDKERADVTIGSRKSTSAEKEQLQDTSKQDKVANIQDTDQLMAETTADSNLQKVNRSGSVFPDILRYRVTETNHSSEVDKRSEKLEKFRNLKRGRSSNDFRPILPKSQYLPECPRAVPIKIAHAINQSDLLNSKSKKLRVNDTDILNNDKVNDALANYQFDAMKPKINTRTEDSYTLRVEEELLNPFLPSMPNLEDLQTDPFDGLLILPEEKINSEEDKSDSACSESTIKIAAKLLQTESKIDEPNVKETVIDASILTEIDKLDKPQVNESTMNVTTVLEIQIPGRSPELIILQTPKFVSAEKLDNRIGDDSPVEATTPVSLTSSFHPASEEPRKNEEINGTGALDQPMEIAGNENLRRNATPTNNYRREGISDILEKDKSLDLRNASPSPGTREAREDEKKVVNKSLDISQEYQRTCRKNRLCRKLQKLYEEETHLKTKLSQSSEPMRVKRLQQKVNCTEKKIENTKKHLDKLINNDRISLKGNSQVSRIQVRRDLIEQKQSPQSEEPISDSSLQLNHRIDETPREKTAPIVITISESDSSFSNEETTETNSDIKPFNDIEEGFVQPQVEVECGVESASESEAVTAEIPTEVSPEISGETVAENAENCAESNEPVEYQGLTNTENQSGVSEAQTVERLDALNPASETTDRNVDEYADKNLTQGFESSPGVATEPSTGAPPSQEQITLPTNRSTPIYPNDKLPNAQPFGTLSFNVCNCVRCSKNRISTSVRKVVASPVAESFIPTSVAERINEIPIRQTVVQENVNLYPASNYPASNYPVSNYPASNYPVSNYPVHRTDYRTTTGSVSGTFSRDNGGANSNLSSPLQGHSALPLPPPYSRNLTAQGYPSAPEITQNPHQTTQWYNNTTHQPGSKSSPAQYTTDQDVRLHSPILAAHLSMPTVQEPANLSRTTKTTSPPQNIETGQVNYKRNSAVRILSERFPSFGNWAAEQVRKEFVVRNPIIVGTVNANLKANKIAAYNSAGTDRYKMAATASDVTPHSSLPETLPPVWGPTRPVEQQRIMVPGFPDPRNNPNLYPRDYPVTNAQTNHPLQYQKSVYNVKPGYGGSELITPYIIHMTHRQQNHHQVPSIAHQTVVQNSSVSNSITEYSNGQQNAWQYNQQTAPQTASLSGIWFNNNSNNNNNSNSNSNTKLGNTTGVLPQYIQQSQQQQQQSLIQPAPLQPPLSYRQIQPRLQNRTAPASASRSKKYERGNSNVSTKGLNRQSENPPCYQQPNSNFVTQVKQSIANGVVSTDVIRLPHNIQNIHAIQSGVTQNRRATVPADIGGSSAAANNYAIFYPSHGSIPFPNALKCLRCGTPAPKFNCADCETAFYCNEYCQRDHWATHSIECRKKMPKLKKVD